MINYTNLVRKITYEATVSTLFPSEFTEKVVLYTPPDPFRIWERLGSLYLEAKHGKVHIAVAIEKEKLADPFIEPNESKNLGEEPFKYQFGFIKWILQDIPPKWYLFNNSLIFHAIELAVSAKQSTTTEIWVDTVGVSHKLKAVKLNFNVIENIKKGILTPQENWLYLPTYSRIIAEVESWQQDKIITKVKYDILTDKVKAFALDGTEITLENINYDNLGGNYATSVDFFEMLPKGGE